MIDPRWSIIGDGTLRRGDGDEYTGAVQVAGFPYHLHGRVQVDEAGRFFALRVYYEPRVASAAAVGTFQQTDSPAQEGLAL